MIRESVSVKGEQYQNASVVETITEPLATLRRGHRRRGGTSLLCYIYVHQFNLSDVRAYSTLFAVM